MDSNFGDEKVVGKLDLLRFPGSAPLSFILTEFHALLMYTDHVKGVSLLNHDVVFEDGFNEVWLHISLPYFIDLNQYVLNVRKALNILCFFQSFGKLINITKDPLRNTIWVFSERAVFKYKVTQEDRNVWQVSGFQIYPCARISYL